VKVNVINDYTLFYDFGVDLKQTHVQHTTCLHRRLYQSSTVVIKYLLVTVSISEQPKVSISEVLVSYGIGLTLVIDVNLIVSFVVLDR